MARSKKKSAKKPEKPSTWPRIVRKLGSNDYCSVANLAKLTEELGSDKSVDARSVRNAESGKNVRKKTAQSTTDALDIMLHADGHRREGPVLGPGEHLRRSDIFETANDGHVKAIPCDTAEAMEEAFEELVAKIKARRPAATPVA